MKTYRIINTTPSLAGCDEWDEDLKKFVPVGTDFTSRSEAEAEIAHYISHLRKTLRIETYRV